MKKTLIILALLAVIITLSFFYSSKYSEPEIIRVVKLPEPSFESENSFESVLLKRRSARDYNNDYLTLEEISQLLWAGQGITSNGLRTAPSAGALYPCELYLVNKEGVFHYLSENSELNMILESDVRADLSSAALGQSHVRDADSIIIIAVIYERITSKYGTRGVMYAHIEAGHIAQNILLQATALNIGSCPVGAFNSKSVNNILKLPKNHEPVYLITLGNID